MPDPARHSELDSRRFGVRVWRADVANRTQAEALVAFVASGKADLVIARAPVTEHAAIALLEGVGFFLCDTLVWWSAPAAAFGGRAAANVRDATAADAGAIRAIALESFRDYQSHYHADPRLDRALIAEGYAEWAGSAKNALVAEIADRVAGFLTWTMASPARGEIVLNAVAPSARRRGLYSALVAAAGARMAAAGAKEVAVSTQLANLAAQRTWARAGFLPAESFHTFHRWST